MNFAPEGNTGPGTTWVDKNFGMNHASGAGSIK